MNESEKDKMLDAAYASFEIEAESLRATRETLDRTEFEKAVEVLASAGRIAAVIPESPAVTLPIFAAA